MSEGILRRATLGRFSKRIFQNICEVYLREISERFHGGISEQISGEKLPNEFQGKILRKNVWKNFWRILLRFSDEIV